MTFHGRARRRSRRAFDTLDAQVNCNRERRGSWLVRSERLNVARFDEGDKERERGWSRRNRSKVHGEKSYVMMVMRMMVVGMTIDVCDATWSRRQSLRRTELPRTRIVKKRTIDVAKRWEKVAVEFSATKKRGRIDGGWTATAISRKGVWRPRVDTKESDVHVD